RTQERSVGPPHLSSTRTSDRGPYLHRFHGVLPARDAQAVHEGAGARPHPTCRHRKTGCHPNDRRPSEYDTDGRTVIMSRYTEPEKDLQLLLQRLKLALPAQSKPRITAEEVKRVA